MPGTIGTAYVQILPSAEGMKGNLTKALGGEGESAGQGLAAKIGAGLKGGLGIAAKAAVAGIAAAGTAAVALGKQALDSYANYEQLIGGIETLFGSSADKVIQDANQAFRTAGMSANDYMDTSIQSAAALIKSLGGDQERAAELMGMSITDMSDNVNKMGTSMEAVQNAYRGFSRGNFTMLDNLALGFAGTKEGMQELLKSAEAISGVKYDINSYADIVDAIHVVQTEMGITGTTAKEAMSTISGSVGATKAAWSNLITGLADDNADFDSLLNNFIDSALTAADNILPRVQTIMGGLGKLITKGAEKILPVVMQTISANLPQLIATGAKLIVTLVTGIIQALPQLVAALPEIFAAIADAFAENWPAIKEAGIQLMILIAQGIGEGIQWIFEQVQAVGSLITEALLSAWESLKAAAAEKWAEIAASVSEAVGTAREALSEWVSAAGEKVNEFVNAIHDGIQSLLTQIGTWIDENLIQPAKDKVAEFVNVGQMVVDNIKTGISNAWGGLTNWFNGLWQGLFGNRDVNVNVNANSNTGAAGRFATGLDYVPYDEFPAILHKGEAVLTAEEASVWRNGGGGGVTINQYLQTVPQTPVELSAATAAYFEQARWAVA